MRLSALARKLIASVASLALVCFYGSFFFPFGPNQMTSEHGEGVVLWVDATSAHLKSSLEPLLRLAETPNPGLEDVGDGAEHAERERWFRFFYSIPASVGWWTLFVLPLALRRLLRRAELGGISRRTRLGLGSLGVVVALAAGLKGLDFYREATTYEGYFHLGNGAYLLVGAYALAAVMLFGFVLASGGFLRSHPKG